MKVYLNKMNLYVERNGLIYQLDSINLYHNDNEMEIHIKLICGKVSNVWYGSDLFTTPLQDNCIIQYFFIEGMKEALEANGYKFLGRFDRLDEDIQKIIKQFSKL